MTSPALLKPPVPSLSTSQGAPADPGPGLPLERWVEGVDADALDAAVEREATAQEGAGSERPT